MLKKVTSSSYAKGISHILFMTQQKLEFMDVRGMLNKFYTIDKTLKK